MKWLIIAVLWLYKRLLSPLLGQRCRFYPSCSDYAMSAVRQHGSFKGSWLAVKRICRCNPFNPGGIDPVPGCEKCDNQEKSWTSAQY